MQRKSNILIAQGGGPTNVINQSLVGIIEEEKKRANVYGSLNGVNGVINKKFVKLDKISKSELNLLKETPGAALGSTRDKPDHKYCLEILDILKKKKIDRFYYIGGNDSSDSLKIISESAKKENFLLQCIHIPKTIDNDLEKNDHTPGFGSAAKYVAQLFSGINYDVKSLPGVYLGIIMGRHAGFLTAAASLLKQKKSDGPHLVYIPEIPFNLNQFILNVKKYYVRYGRCVVAISEGIQDKNNQLISKKISKSKEYDAHGNIQLSGSGLLGDYLADQIKNKLKISRVRADTLGYAQRSFLGTVSEVDQEEAYLIGKSAVKLSSTSLKSFSAGIKIREKMSSPYRVKFIRNELADIAGKTRKLPIKFYNRNTFNVSNLFFEYAKPLIGKNIRKTTSII